MMEEELYLIIFTLWRIWQTSIFFTVVAKNEYEGKAMLDKVYPLVKYYKLDDFVFYKAKLPLKKGVVKELKH